MYLVYLTLFVIASYLYGSINYAIILFRVLKKSDIRKLDSKRAGTANIGRNLGKGWGALVFFLDISKGLLPLILAKIFVFTDFNYADYLALFAISIAAIVGHCRPLFFNFKGGGGIVTAIGIFMFFIPVEFFTSMLIGFIISQIFFRNMKYSIGQITPIIFVSLTPFLTLVVSFMLNIKISGNLSIGGYPWFIILGVFALTFVILLMNLHLFKGRLKEF